MVGDSRLPHHTFNVQRRKSRTSCTTKQVISDGNPTSWCQYVVNGHAATFLANHYLKRTPAVQRQAAAKAGETCLRDAFTQVAQAF